MAGSCHIIYRDPGETFEETPWYGITDLGEEWLEEGKLDAETEKIRATLEEATAR